ncbi:DUF1652 domain-containing protein [Pseudomonas mandelii]|uniref:DUF1652 domain-containing protein n=1 Tax=Pseudomonas mandelii TaxID=75612 RepID=UPI00224B710D|nr:DUF1652 domain-containing protein [Pseudomonas mandelii]MCX2899316.1 DUF1652 domain-containing protein [Pseudomonas mandelii]
MMPISVLSSIVESGFKPLSCECTESLGLLENTIFDPGTRQIVLFIRNVSAADLTSIRSINNLIAELRREINAGRRAFAG